VGVNHQFPSANDGGGFRGAQKGGVSVVEERDGVTAGERGERRERGSRGWGEVC